MERKRHQGLIAHPVDPGFLNSICNQFTIWPQFLFPDWSATVWEI